MLFQQLHCDKAVGFDFGFRELLLFAKQQIVMQYAVVRQREGEASCRTTKSVVVIVLFRAALCHHTGMPHNDPCIIEQPDMQLVGRQGTLVDVQLTPAVVGKPCCICAACFAFCR